MIHPFGHPDPPVPRLVAALAERGHEVGPRSQPAETADDRASTLVLGSGTGLDDDALAMLLGTWKRTRGARVLVLSALGAHPDARAPRLRQLWDLEERVRGSRLAVMTLRLAPLVGPASPLWLRMRSRPRLPRQARALLNPVAESDVIETIERALDGRARWEGWYEVAGPEVFSLAELAEIARLSGAPTPPGSGAWEPPLVELEEHRLAEAGPWLEHFAIVPHAIEERCRAWAA